jgi:hypothetical protein
MGRTAYQADFAERLRALKDRSGRSYHALGKRCGVSSSTLHRYCTGGGVPAEFLVVDRFGKACGAGGEELAELRRLWMFALVRPEPEPAVVTPVRRSFGWRTPVGVAVVVLLTFGLVTASRPVTPAVRQTGASSVPMWTDKPIGVGREFVGVTKNSTSGEMPAFGVGAVRLWNSGTRWEKLEPERGRFEWFRLDRLVEPAREAGVPVLFTLGGTPAWASPDGPETVFGDGSRTSPPDDLDDWDRFVGELARVYRGRIDAYELWDAANHQRIYSGSVETMVAMTERAARVIKAADPAAEVVCPGMAELWEPHALRWQERFAELGGYQHCDVLGVKLHQRWSADPPERMLELATEIDRTLYRAGVPEMPRWNMGQGFATGVEERLDPELAADHAVRFYLVSLYAEYTRVYFYNWGSDRIPIVLQPSGGIPTRAARHVDELGSWLRGARNTFCGNGAKLGLPDHVWQCGFTKDGTEFQIVWTDGPAVPLTPPRVVEAVEVIDGERRPEPPDGSVEITGRPVVLRLT